MIATHEPNPEAKAGICYVETKSLDGETNLKIRQVCICAHLFYFFLPFLLLSSAGRYISEYKLDSDSKYRGVRIAVHVVVVCVILHVLYGVVYLIKSFVWKG